MMIVYYILASVIAILKTIHYTITYIYPNRELMFKSQIIASVVITLILSFVLAPFVLLEVIYIKTKMKRGN